MVNTVSPTAQTQSWQVVITEEQETDLTTEVCSSRQKVCSACAAVWCGVQWCAVCRHGGAKDDQSSETIIRINKNHLTGIINNQIINERTSNEEPNN